MLQAPLVLITLVAATGGILVLVLLSFRLIWTRLKAIPFTALERQLDELGDRQRAIEAKLSELLEASARENVTVDRSRRSREAKDRVKGPKSSIRIDRAQAAGSLTGPTLIAIPNLASPATQLSDEAAVELADRFGGIWSLADEGHTPDVVARTTGLPIGQVELILALRRQSATHTGDS